MDADEDLVTLAQAEEVGETARLDALEAQAGGGSDGVEGKAGALGERGLGVGEQSVDEGLADVAGSAVAGDVVVEGVEGGERTLAGGVVGTVGDGGVGRTGVGAASVGAAGVGAVPTRVIHGTSFRACSVIWALTRQARDSVVRA